jgi:hypothetical protein
LHPVADQIYDAKLEGIKNMVGLLNHVLKQHHGLIWILGASLMSPDGRKLLILGAPYGGKTTAVLTLVFRCSWKVLSEDVTLIDPGTNEIINFAAPLALKPGTIELVKEAASIVPGPVESDRWIPLREHSLGRNVKTPFDLALYLDLSGGQDKLSCEKMPVNEYVRAMLQTSNLISMPGSVDKIYEYVRGDSCYRITAGSIQQRLKAILQLCDATSSDAVRTYTVGSE